jgi:hypothetical protein
MYTRTTGLMFDTPEDAARAANLLDALFEQAQARQPLDDTGSDEIQTVHGQTARDTVASGWSYWPLE